MTGHDKIIKECAHGKYFDSLVHRYSALVFDEVFFVDGSEGTDTSDGESFSTALKTINAAVAKANDYKQSAIIYRCPSFGGNKNTEMQVIDKSGVHLLGGGALYGFGGGWNSVFLPPTACDEWATIADATRHHVGISLQERDVEIAGMKFFTYDVNGVTSRQFHIASAKASGVPLGFFSIHDNIIQGDVTGVGLQGGIYLEGMERGFIGLNYFYELEEAITLQTGGADYTTGMVIEDNRYQGCKYGIRLLNGACLNHIAREKMWGKGALGRGWTMTQGILIGSGGNDNVLEDVYVATATELTAITDGGSNNAVVDCWYGLGPGAKTIWNGP